MKNTLLRGIDPVLTLSLIALMLIGGLMVFSSSVTIAEAQHAQSSHYLMKQWMRHKCFPFLHSRFF